ncbi:winged helix-turn-helix domain-containing protein [Halobellus inordinatus]|uniref:winged helix-turn-helix domain-containing protein n=1 Tax=Halobellus inordinatus TaxID=1126236 RepID=UPI002114EE06|nr:winged helix-turn-helix domain-containing protein [Halobellus ramosii]
MRKSGKWMVLLDERILELLEEDEGGFMRPSEIANDSRIPYSRAYVGQRCQKLADHGLIQEVSTAVYRITDEGRAYLEGTYDASETNDVTVDTSDANSEQGSDQAGQ